MEWTDDMTVRLGHGTSALTLVSYLRASNEEHLCRSELLTVLTERFALPFDDARLALDRFQGGITRAMSGNAANEPDQAKDPIAWASYQLELGLPVDEAPLGPPPEVEASASALLDRARNGEPTSGTEDVAVALEVTRVAVASQEPAGIRFHLLLEAATSISVAAETCISRLQQRQWPCAPAGSEEWVDGVALAAAARQVTTKFASQPDPEFEERSLGLVGRVVTMILGQCHAFVGRAMVESAQCIKRNGDPKRAATHVEPVLTDFEIVLEWFQDDGPFDEHVTALNYLLEAIDLIIEVRGSSTELDNLRRRTSETLGRAVPDNT